MGTKAGVGISHHRNPKMAAKEAVELARKESEIEGKPDFVFMFSSVGYKQKPLLDEVCKLVDNAPLAGSSGEGIIVQQEADESPFSIAVMLIKSNEITFTHTYFEGVKENSLKAGQTIASNLKSYINETTLGLMTFSDGLTLNFDKFYRGVEEELKFKKPLPIFGGTSSDHWEMKKTYQYFNNQLLTDSSIGILMNGSLNIAWSVHHGCSPIGLKRVVTKAKGNKIYEIDNKPVLDILKEYLLDEEVDDWSKAVVNLSWGLKAPGEIQSEYDEYIIRFMPGKDDKEGAIYISTEVVDGTYIWMTRRDNDKIIESINRISKSVKEQLKGNTPKIVFHFDCAGRGKVILREQQKLEVLKSLQENIGDSVPWIGFYTYGEIGPVHNINNFHNYTLVLLAIY